MVSVDNTSNWLNMKLLSGAWYKGQRIHTGVRCSDFYICLFHWFEVTVRVMTLKPRPSRGLQSLGFEMDNLRSCLQHANTMDEGRVWHANSFGDMSSLLCTLWSCLISLRALYSKSWGKALLVTLGGGIRAERQHLCTCCGPGFMPTVPAAVQRFPRCVPKPPVWVL